MNNLGEAVVSKASTSHSTSQSSGIKIRPARVGDEEAAAGVLRSSIAELCAADHGGDPAIVARWLGNKTPETVRSWIVGAGKFVVAEMNGRMVGVGSASPSGEIVLNYVAPDARFRGVSKALLFALEDYARAQGVGRSTLSSTRTAHRFYLQAGYTNVGEAQSWGGLTALPMSKVL